jgi:hypothetical protein
VKTTFTVADPSREKHLKEKAEEERIRSKEMLERRQVIHWLTLLQ